MKIKTSLLRAADEFRGRGEVRGCFNGIHINKHFIEATNGHVAVRMTSDLKTRLDVIVRFKGKIPKSAQKTHLKFSKVGNVAYHYDGFDVLVSAQVFDIEEGKFPSIAKVIPKDLGNDEFPALQPKYLTIIDKAFCSNKFGRFIYTKPIQYSKDKCVLFTIGPDLIDLEFNSPIILIMPTRD